MMHKKHVHRIKLGHRCSLDQAGVSKQYMHDITQDASVQGDQMVQLTNENLGTQNSLELKNLYADITNSKDAISNVSYSRGRNNMKGLFKNMDQLYGLGGEILSQFRYETGSLNLSKQSINLLGALSQASFQSSLGSSIKTIRSIQSRHSQKKLALRLNLLQNKLGKQNQKK